MNSDLLNDDDDALHDIAICKWQKQQAAFLAKLSREEKERMEPLARVVLDNEIREQVTG